MTRAGRQTKRRRAVVATVATGVGMLDVLKARLTNPDNRSHAEFLRDMRAEQAAGRLRNPDTAALLDRLEAVNARDLLTQPRGEKWI